MIIVVCSECGSRIGARDDYAGRQSKCPKCKAAISIPVPSAADTAIDVLDRETNEANPTTVARTERVVAERIKVQSPPAKRESVVSEPTVVLSVPVSTSSELKARILAALDSRIEPVKVTLGYRLAIVVVAALMVLLPLIYVALIGLVGYGVFWHLTNHTGMLHNNVRGKGQLMVVLAYAAPAIVGVVMIAFMLKPLFARRRSTGEEPQTIQRGEEPFLFEFVDRLCDAVGSPRPKSILFDDNVNAAAALISGVWNPFRHDLMLVIGLPLVAGMSLRQLSGVMAHEFGHFSQGAGMRLGGIINSVNYWFAYVVYQRDEWDQTLENWSKQADLQYGWVIYAARGCVWLTRKILWCLMSMGRAMSCRLSREMEFDADRHDVRLAGSATFSEATVRMPILVGARNWAISDLSESYRERRLVDDFFSLISHRAEQIPADVRQKLIDEQMNSKTGWFDTHPCDSERIASVNRENAPGILQIDAPASVLFEDFSGRCREETRKFYQRELNQEIPQKYLVPLGSLLARQKAAEDEDKAAARVLCRIYHFLWTFPLPDSLEPTSRPIEEVVDEIQSLRNRLAGHRATYKEVVAKLFRNFMLIQEANLAEILLNSKLIVNSNTFSLPMTNLDEMNQVRTQARVDQQETLDSFAPILQDVSDRIYLPLQLLSNAAVAAKIADASNLWKESQKLISANTQLRRFHADLIGAYDARELIRDIIKQLQNGVSQEKLVPGLMKSVEQGFNFLSTMRENLSSIEYPFDHTESGFSVGQYLIEELPPKEHFGAVDHGLSYAADEGMSINCRLISRLCAIVEIVETALGLPLGEAPVDVEESQES